MDMLDELASFLAVVVFCLVHIFVDRFKFLHGESGNKWVSASGGVGIAYVFVYLLPKLADKQLALLEYTGNGIWRYLENHAYLIAIVGLVVFIGVEASVKELSTPISSIETDSKNKNRNSGLNFGQITFVCCFGLYSFLLGYLFSEFHNLEWVSNLVLAVVSMTLHLIGLDHVLLEIFKSRYNSMLRWVLTAMMLLGWLFGILTVFSAATITIFFSFLAGSIVAIALRVELSPHGQVLFLPFCLGLVANIFLIYGFLYLSLS